MINSNRLFVTGYGPDLKHYITTSRSRLWGRLKPEELETLRVPNPDEIRVIWDRLKLSEISSHQAAEKMGVARQTVLNWRKKAGVKTPHVSLVKREKKHQAAKIALKTARSLVEAAEKAGLSESTVRRIANEAGITFQPRNRKRPSDEELIKLADGRTWPEFAKACGMTLPTLRNYVYSQPKLSAKISKKIKKLPGGGAAHNKLDVKAVAELYEAGETAYQIAKKFDVSTAAISYWVDKLELKHKPKGKKRDD